jgi:murein DD-endopeptidase / murein LD-carboxypeptidase
MPADLAVCRARALLGTRFRLHGRDPETGLDCVGLVALAHDLRGDVPNGYALRNSDAGRWCHIVDQFACRRAPGALHPGDILMLHAGPAQLHLGIWAGASLIHADARLDRIVELPGPLPWITHQAWHVIEEKR